MPQDGDSEGLRELDGKEKCTSKVSILWIKS